MNRYNRLDNQAPAVKEMESNDVNVGRSAHDCSHIVNGNTMIGMLAPVLTMEVVLNEDIDINLASLIEFRNPSTRHLFNSFRVYFHGYFNALTDLWEGAKNWLDNGRSGNLQLTRPNLVYHYEAETDFGTKVNACTPMSLLNFMGMPVEAFGTDYVNGPSSQSTDKKPPLLQFTPACKRSGGVSPNIIKYDFDEIGKHTDYFPADVCMAYQRNWRDYYANKNLLQNNKKWFPDNEDHFILGYSCENAVAINYENEDFHDTSLYPSANQATQIFGNILGWNYPVNKNNFRTPECNNPHTSDSDVQPFVSVPNLSGIKFRQFRGDRFTTGSPFPELIRGEIPVLNLNVDSLSVDGNIRYWFDDTDEQGAYTTEAYLYNNGSHITALYSPSDPTSTETPGPIHTDSSQLKVPLSSLGVTMSDIYTLETLTAFRSKMGMTNGDYSEMMEAQFGVKPKVHNRRGTYIGGFYQDFALSSITQTSESANTPLGTKAGQGISSGSGRIGHIHTTDFGWIQVYMSIMPDVYYTQGKPRQFSKRSNLEMYFPLFNNLPAQGIRNDELFISGDSTVDSQPFAYEDRYAEFKSFPNRVTGFMGLPVAKAEFDTARVIARRFTSTPALNSLFVSAVPENIDMSVFSVVDEPPFDFSIGFSIRRVFPGPYTAVEGSLSSPRLNA